MSSERAGAPTHGALNREQAREVLRRMLTPYDPLVAELRDSVLDVWVSSLEACVVPDRRIARIEALLDQPEDRPGETRRYLRAILRGDQ